MHPSMFHRQSSLCSRSYEPSSPVRRSRHKSSSLPPQPIKKSPLHGLCVSREASPIVKHSAKSPLTFFDTFLTRKLKKRAENKDDLTRGRQIVLRENNFVSDSSKFDHLAKLLDRRGSVHLPDSEPLVQWEKVNEICAIVLIAHFNAN